MRELLQLHAAGRLDPEPVSGLGELPEHSTRAERALRELLRVRFGLALADGTSEPLMVSTSELVAAGIVATRGGASKLLHRFERLGVVWSPGEMEPARGWPRGTRLFLPGAAPANPFVEPPGGWRVESAPSGSDDVPVAGLVTGAVAVEAQNVGAVEPLVEAEDEPLVADAVGAAGVAGPLDGVAAVVGGAEPGGGGPRVVGHAGEGYAQPPTVRERCAELGRIARGRARPGTRNHTGLWLGCQLRDAGADWAEAVHYMECFVLIVNADHPGDHPYTVREALASLGQAYRREPREPWLVVPARVPVAELADFEASLADDLDDALARD
jgi:hypothetical protein